MASNATTIRIDPKIKKEAAHYLGQMGLNVSEATRIFLHSVVLHKGMPFDLKIPNEKTQEAIDDAKTGKNIQSAQTPEEMFEKLGI